MKKNFNDFPLSNIKLKDVNIAYKDLDEEEMKKYRLRILGIRVQWKGRAVRVVKKGKKPGRNYFLEVDPIAKEDHVSVFLDTRGNIENLQSLAGEKIIFSGFVYRFGSKGNPFVYPMKIENFRYKKLVK